MAWDRDSYTDEEWARVNSGKLCPNATCKSTEIKYMGDSFDGINCNAAWDCKICGTQWEGE